MKFVKVFDENDGIIDLNVNLVLKVKEDIYLDKAIITDLLGNKYKSLESYKEFIIKVCVEDTETLKDLLK